MTLAFIVFFTLMGCAVGPNFAPPITPCPCEYTEDPQPKETVSTAGPSGQSQKIMAGCDIPGEWWTLFRSKELNCLIEEGLRHNPNLKAAQAAVRVAHQNLRAGAGLLFPTVTATGGITRQRSSDVSIDLPTRPTIFELFSTSVNVTYNLDIFGGTRRQIEALKALMEFQSFEYEATYLTLTSNIATTAILEASLREQIAATHDLIELNRKQVEVLRKQFELGAIGKADVLNQETLLAQTEATLPPLEKNLAAARSALAALVGTVPGESCLPIITLSKLHLPRDVPISVPSKLVCQRPDVRSSLALLHQSCALVGVATANLLPTVSLTAAYGTLSNTGPTFFIPKTIVWNAGFQVAQTLFSGGTLIAQRRAAVATFEQSYEKYQNIVLNAFKNVADSLKALETDAQAYKALVEAEKAAKDSFLLIQEQYRLGGSSLLLSLYAQRQYQQARLLRIQAEGARYSNTVALFQSLGGGWWNAPCPDTLPAGWCEDKY